MMKQTLILATAMLGQLVVAQHRLAHQHAHAHHKRDVVTDVVYTTEWVTEWVPYPTGAPPASVPSNSPPAPPPVVPAPPVNNKPSPAIPTTTTTPPPPPPASTPPAVAAPPPASSPAAAPAPPPPSGGSPSGGSTSGGYQGGGSITFYGNDPESWAGDANALTACGVPLQMDSKWVALGSADGGTSKCGKMIEIQGIDGGKAVTVPVQDLCPGCGAGHLDLTFPVFMEVTGTDQAAAKQMGTTSKVSWSWAS